MEEVSVPRCAGQSLHDVAIGQIDLLDEKSLLSIAFDALTKADTSPAVVDDRRVSIAIVQYNRHI